MTSSSVQGTAHLRRVAISSYLGTTIEYYDFLLYGTAAALIFNKIFFTDLPPLVGTIVALATLAAGYVARLAGAVLFGHFGDRLGRKAVMFTTMIIMGVASGLIGVLPAYAQIGAAAPLLLVLLRVLQGLAVGGEYGGAVLMTAEHAGDGRRGLVGAAAVMGGPSGSVLATIAMLLVTLLPDDQLLSWGWRIPFLVSFVLLAVGLYFRVRIAESPVFLARQGERRPTGLPIVALLRAHPGTLLKSIVFQAGPYCGQGVFGIFMISYAPGIGYSRSTALLGVLLGSLGSALITPVYAALSDRIGRKPVVMAGALGTAAFAYPGFLLINSANTTLYLIAIVGYVALVMTPVTAVAPVMLSELFPTEIRYTAVSAGYQLAQTVGSGFGPLIGASLLAAAGGGTRSWLIAAFLVAAGLVSAAATRFLPETRAGSLTEVTTSRAGMGAPAVAAPPAEGHAF